jgi:hypothetical protein
MTMTKPLAVLSVLALLVLSLSASVALAQAPPEVEIELLNPPDDGVLELAVGESHTFDIQVTSSDPFLLAMVLPDQYYPGRGLFIRGGDRAGRDSTALLQLTITGKQPTAGLEPVLGWPVAGFEWPEGGVAPVSLAVGVRFPGGLVYGEHFTFAVLVE